jgi:hypothetical protein
MLLWNKSFFFLFGVALNLMLTLTSLGSVGLGLRKNDGLGLMGSQVFCARALPVLMPASYHIGCAARIEMAIGAAYHIDKPWAHNKKDR